MKVFPYFLSFSPDVDKTRYVGSVCSPVNNCELKWKLYFVSGRKWILIRTFYISRQISVKLGISRRQTVPLNMSLIKVGVAVNKIVPYFLIF
jgi:hypothetical protein